MHFPFHSSVPCHHLALDDKHARDRFFLSNKKLEHKLLSENVPSPKKSNHCIFPLSLQTRQFSNLQPGFQLGDGASLLLLIQGRHRSSLSLKQIYCELFFFLAAFALALCCTSSLFCNDTNLLCRNSTGDVFSFQFQAISCWIIVRLMVKFQAWRTIIVCDYLHCGGNEEFKDNNTHIWWF